MSDHSYSGIVDALANRLEDQFKSYTRSHSCGAYPALTTVEVDTIVSALRASLQPATPTAGEESARKALQSLEYWCTDARMGLGAVDGYDYRSGEEYGIRRVEIELHKRLTAIPATGGDAVAHAIAQPSGNGKQLINEILAWYAEKNITPGDGWALPDDNSSLCFEDSHRITGHVLWIDLENDGSVHLLFRPSDKAEVRSIRFVAPVETLP